MLLVYDSSMWSEWVTMKDVKELWFLGRPPFATQIEILRSPVSLECSKNLIPKFSTSLNNFWIIKQQFFQQNSNSDFAFLDFQALLLVQISSNFKTRLSYMLSQIMKSKCTIIKTVKESRFLAQRLICSALGFKPSP